MRRIIVCVKITGGELNPFDAAALECALQMPEAECTVLCMGRRECLDTLKGLSRLGGARTVLLSDPCLPGSDTLATSYALSQAIRKLIAEEEAQSGSKEATLLFCGRESIDGNTAQVGPMLAAMLDWPLIPYILFFEKGNYRTREGIEGTLNETNAVLTFERIALLRFPSLQSKVGTVEVRNAQELDIDSARCGLAGSPTRVLSTERPIRERSSCQWITRADLSDTILRLDDSPTQTLVTEFITEEKRFPRLYTVGDEIHNEVRSLAKSVTTIPKMSVPELVERIKRERPEIVLWNADRWGRAIAPQVAALLKTGLCADCTQLERKGDRLIMIRPTAAGEVLARIECRTFPQMATVRTKETTSSLFVVFGLGVADHWDRALQWVQELGVEWGASRGLVDTGRVPYERQIGLTGRRVVPKIALSIGCSGSIQNLCGIDGARYIIAINPDRKARIFDYADFGIAEPF